ncbi:MAG: hypothetical protein C5B59_06975 [Bacteroidetes bacterium]|nr:MAG: hypothetical protein C5B59_06975 [Bacteroidota bacterium]
MTRRFTKINAALAALVTELIVLGIAAIMASDRVMFWQYAARYSARVSFVVFASVLFYMAIFGLLTISNNENKRKIFEWLLYFFVTNHIIHLILLTFNQAVHNKMLLKQGNIPGMIAYGIVLLLPLLLNRGLLTKRKRTLMVASLLLVSAFFIQVYVLRLIGSSLPPDSSATWVYLLFVSVLSLLVVANLYRYIMDARGSSRQTIGEFNKALKC